MGVYLQVMTWRAGVLARRHVARGTTAWVRRGAEATWQSHEWPAHGLVAHRGARARGKWPHDHAGPRGRPCGAPRVLDIEDT